MSNLLDKASILLTPTAYNNGSMLSVKPTDGDGDFTFVRGSAATRVNAQGLVENVQIISSELVTNGDFSNGSTGWTVINGNITDKYNASMTAYQSGIRVTPFNKTGKFKVLFDLVITSGNMKFDAGGVNNQTYTTSGTKEIIIINPTKFEFNAFNLGWVGTLDNVSVKEVTDDTNLPRINYEGFSYDGNGDIIPNSGCGSWLLENQSTNLYLNSETLVTQSNATSASTYTVSFYGSGSITFSGTHIGSLVGNGADERVSVTFTATSGTLTSTIIGSVNKGQLEEQTHSTSYIPTSGATNTRNQDISTNSGNATLINSTEGVLYAEIAALADSVNGRYISIGDGSLSNYVYIRITGILNEIKMGVIKGGSTQASKSFTVPNLKQSNKLAVSYQQDLFRFYVNGTLIFTDTNGDIFPIGTLNALTFNLANTNNYFNGKNKCLAVYKEALTSAELQSLTTI